MPVNRIQEKETLEYGGTYGVVWSYKKVYDGFLICSGIYYIYIYKYVTGPVKINHVRSCIKIA